MSDHYSSPYGFGPIADAVIDCVAERRGLTQSEIEDRVFAIKSATEIEHPDGSYDESAFDMWVYEDWWNLHMGPAIDAMENYLYPQDPE